MKVALLGAGLAAGGHVRALAALGTEVAAVATRDSERHARVLEHFPRARRCWPPETALADVDLALVLTPPSTHLDLVAAAAARGIDVVVEKPLEVSAERARALVETAEAAGIGLAVSYQHRAKEAGAALHRLVTTGGLGRLVGGNLQMAWWRPQSYYDEPGRGRIDRDGGGVLITQAIHALDLMVWALGAPERVLAVASRSPVHELEAEDTMTALLGYPGGATVSALVTTAAPPGTAEQLTLVGSEATATLRGPRLDVHWIDRTEPATWGSEAGSGIAADTSLMPADWHIALLRDAITAFSAGREPLASGRSALSTQYVVQALYDSAGTGEWTAVPGRDG